MLRGRSFVSTDFKANQPLQTKAIDDSTIPRTPRTLLQIVDDRSASSELREPLTHDSWVARSKKRQHQTFASKRRFIARNVGTKELNVSVCEVSVRDPMPLTVSSMKLRERMKFNLTSKNLTVGGQCLSGIARKVNVRNETRHMAERNTHSHQSVHSRK